MARILEPKKACAVNPLKMSQPLGAAYAFMGMDSCMPLMHGSQGCTSFGLVLLVRHFKEAIPLQTTAMNEVTTILGGTDNLERALVNIRERARPKLIAICSTGLTETKGDDVAGDLALIRARRPELADTALVHVSTPDYVGAFEGGFGAAVAALARTFVQPTADRVATQVNLLPGAHLTPADVDELRGLCEAFGLHPIVLPDVSGSLDGHIPDDWRGTTLGGTTLAQVEAMGASAATIAIGEHMRAAAAEIARAAGVPYTVLDRVTGLAACDTLLATLSTIAGRRVPDRLRRQRSQLQDAMLDGHFHFGGVKVAIAAEPDLLVAVGSLLHEMGAELACCVTTTASPALARLPADTVTVGDLDDLERGAAAAGCGLLVTHSHGRQASERLGLPLVRVGIPMFDRIGNQHRVSVGYRGTMSLIFEIGNVLIDRVPHAAPDAWPLPVASLAAAAPLTA
ncbi:MAG: nitrogenase iron-molybdenum cofactor biosynthesis protein NifN [Burkholderiaceae bacterium]